MDRLELPIMLSQPFGKAKQMLDHPDVCRSTKHFQRHHKREIPLDTIALFREFRAIIGQNMIFRPGRQCDVTEIAPKLSS